MEEKIAVWKKKALDKFIELERLIASLGIREDEQLSNLDPYIRLDKEDLIKSATSGQQTLYWSYHWDLLIPEFPLIEARLRLVIGEARDKGAIDIIYNPEEDLWYADTIYANNSLITKELSKKIPKHRYFPQTKAWEFIRAIVRAFFLKKPYFIDPSKLPS